MSFESYFFKYPEYFGIGIFDRVFSAVLYWFVKYVTDVNIKENKELIIAADVWYDELTYLITAYFSSDGLTMNVSVMITKTWCFFA